MSFNLSSVMGMFRPTLKSEDTIINNLKAAKTIEPGTMSGMMQSVLSGGLSKFLQNPSGSSGGKAQQAAGDSSSQVSTAAGGQNSLSLALGGLATDISLLMSQAENIVGLGSDDTSMLTTLGWTQIGDAMGEPYTSSTILKPANAEDELNNITGEIYIIANQYLLNQMTLESSTARINELRAEIQGITAASQNAITQITNAVVRLTTALASASLYNDSILSDWKSIMDRAIKDEHKAELQQAKLAQLSDENGNLLTDQLS